MPESPEGAAQATNSYPNRQMDLRSCQPARPSLTTLCPPHSKLRPPTSSERKSQLLSICLHSVLALPLLDVLEKHTCLFLEPLNIQV